MTNYEPEFMQLIMGLQSSGWMLLGKLANPMTGTQERNLAGAKQTIDVLLMLQVKTKGNLSKGEEALLNGAITQLQINYVDELSKEKGKIEPDQDYEETIVEHKKEEEPKPKKKSH